MNSHNVNEMPDLEAFASGFDDSVYREETRRMKLHLKSETQSQYGKKCLEYLGSF